MANPWDQYAAQEAAAPWDKYADAPEVKPSKRDQALMANNELLQNALNYSGKDATGGLVRGNGSIGATLLAPIDAAARAMGVENSYIGRNDRREAMDGGLKAMGVNTDSIGFKTNKLIGEVASTAPVGGALGQLAARFGLSAPAVASLTSGGMNVAGQTGARGLVTRAAGGAVTGGATAGLVDPEYAPTGALIGAAAPVAAKVVGKVGEELGKRSEAKADAALAEFNRRAPFNQTVKESIDAGYVIPPNMVNPSLKNQVIESISGKQATQQIFSGKNEKVTGQLVRQSLGIADDAPLSQQALENLRKTAGKTYADVSSLSPTAAADLEALKVARNDATGWFNAYNRSARPDDLAKAKAARALSDQLENALEQHAISAGKTDLIPALREARKQIAKTYTVGRALNDASGTVDARVLGRMHEKGLPLSDGLDTAGKFASAFRTVAKSSPEVGSQAAHNLKAVASSMMGVGGFMSGGPVGAAAAAIPFLSPPVARSMMLREGAQKALIQQAPQAAQQGVLSKILMDQELQRLLMLSAPVATPQFAP